jgi:hypothetical protein
MKTISQIPTLMLAGAMALTAQIAAAGPWLRAEGDVFLAFGAEISEDSDTDPYFTAYGEWGAGRKLTLVLDLGGDENDLSKAVLFARFPITGDGSTWRVAGELGGGDYEANTVIRPGLSIGRGITLRSTPGWFTIDAYGYADTDGWDAEWNTDVTFGLSTTEKSKVIVQLQSSYDEDDLNSLKLAQSYVYEFAPGQHVELGLLAELHSGDDVALKLGLWSSF